MSEPLPEPVQDGYCEVDDLLLGDLPLHNSTLAQRYINNAAEEIDSKIAPLYQTPVKINPEDVVKFRSTIFTLKRINQFLASGRIIMAMAAPGENNIVHQYGITLVREAQREIDRIVNRDLILDGATPNSNAPSDFAVSRAYVYQLDKESAVEGFYSMVNPVLDGETNSFLTDRRYWR